MGNPRCDGLMFRITVSLAPNGLVLMGAQYGFQAPEFVWPLIGTLIGHSFIGLNSSAIPLGITSLNTGSVDIPVALPNTIPPALIGTELVFQSIVWDTGISLAEWTNAQVVHL